MSGAASGITLGLSVNGSSLWRSFARKIPAIVAQGQLDIVFDEDEICLELKCYRTH